MLNNIENSSALDDAQQALIKVAQTMTSNKNYPLRHGSLSYYLEDGMFLMTKKGVILSDLKESDLIVVDEHSLNPQDHEDISPYFVLHKQIYTQDETLKIVSHINSVNAAVLSRYCLGDQASVLKTIEQYEMLTSFQAIETYDAYLPVPIVANSDDFDTIAVEMNAMWEYMQSMGQGYLIGGNGLVTWAKDADELIENVHAWEYLLDCEFKAQLLAAGA